MKLRVFFKWMKWKSAVLICLVSAVAANPAASQNIADNASGAKCELIFSGDARVDFTMNSDADLRCLADAVNVELKKESKLPKPANLRQRSEAKQYRRGLQEVLQLVHEALAHQDVEQRNRALDGLRETIAALANNPRPRIPDQIDGFAVPAKLLGQLNRAVGKGRTPADNLQNRPTNDLSLLDPKLSIFWRRPKNILAEDLYDGFGRTHWLNLENKVCTYARAKDSFGTNPGFEVDCDGAEVKLKFAELSSEPLTTRMFAALGFHADATDYARWAKVRYDRRIFQEFNSRQALKTRFTMLEFLPLYTMNLQKRYDPFAYIARVVLRNGQEWTGSELKAKLFRDAARKHPETDTNNFLPAAEAQIDYLVTVPANVQVKDEDAKNIGPWDPAQLDHADRRELRGSGLLAAWLGFFDTRFDNTKLRLVDNGRGEELTGYFSDLGGGMGQTHGILFMKGERPNEFPWRFTRPPLWQGPGKLSRPLRISGYEPIAPTPPFTAMTRDDARWMARLIGQLSEKQITQALVASGFDSAETKLYAEKLVNRRDEMIKDLGLAEEVGLLRPNGINHSFNYDPLVSGPVTVEVTGRGIITAKKGAGKIVRGRFVETPQ